ncbi:terminase large subunit domain-containing protein [Streptomyces caniscabiei]|uniref:Terminase family protein n=1 Tax=Streptomyces caniscabiei TaxID=2746961 RepID=A0ABU4MPS4_9ACTN|nr:terminase family protein [Streptomyces caniscabiei]MBE4788407.1 DNA-packaging protein [Streptomyces caniscabiei]MDX2954610.1 terminase family protein [Streptomyces caniscabiei]MDX2986581.1 terminase family protein [Streptomyces caniscabiei]MDX3039460.1 terminase family protein [Streptomyces caniscabiei]
MGTDDRATVAARAAALLGAQLKPRWQPQPHQIPPDGNWTGWLLMAGRGAGKSKACAEYVRQHVNGPPCLPGPVPHWIAIIAPTLGDGVTSMYEGPGGIRNADPGARLVQAPGGMVIRWPNGSQAKMYGSHTPEDVERLRAGGNSCLAVLEEFATWRYMEQTYDQLRFGLRSGPRPHWIAATTPKPRPLLKRMLSGDIAGIVHTHATMYDNPHLEQSVKDALEDTYAGTDIGAQELHGRLIDEVSEALWTRATLEETRVRADEVPELKRISVGVDPSGGAGEQGIVVVGKSGLLLPGALAGSPLDAEDALLVRAQAQERPQYHGFVLDDRSCKLSPDQWGRRAVQAAIDWDADELVAETNYGGAMCVATLRTAAEALGVDIPIRTVTATRGKVVRAQPVAALSAQGRWHMAGVFPELEDQLATWYPELGWSPDRLDAMVWPAWQMKLVGTAPRGQGSLGGGLARKQIVGGRLR